ncbi:MAG: tRNA lysidine(34) synthetase TilS [Clostridiaceae bacterium]
MNIASINYVIRQLQQKVLNAIRANRLTDPGDVVVVGVSGGPDSVCLLHILHALSEHLGIKLHAIHINHMLRPEEAPIDEAYTAALCKRMEISLLTVHVDIASMAKKLGMSVEEAGREARYREFEKYAGEIGAAKIAVAHNRNDQAETVMMHIIRGAGTAGLAGMEYRRGAVIRPLLQVSRSEIEQYCEAAELSPRTDSSNLKSDFTRNRVRLELFPFLEKNFGADIVDSLCRLSAHAAEDREYLEMSALKAFHECSTESGGGKVGMKLELLQKLHPAILNRVLKQAVMEAAGNVKGIGSVHYQALSELVAKDRTGAQAELPGGLKAEVSYGILHIYKNSLRQLHSISKRKKTPLFEVSLAVPGSTVVQELEAVVVTSVETVLNVDKYGNIGYNSFEQYFDYDSLKRGINIRNRRDGDIFKPLKSNGTKKLKEYLIDMKVPRELRDDIPLVCTGNEVVWIIGYKISDKFKVTENTKSTLKIEYNRRTSL